MKSKTRKSRSVKRIFLYMIGIMFSVSTCACAASNDKEKEVKNVILIGWDGTQRDHFMELFTAGKLPNLKKIIDEGSLAFTQVTTGKTQTKPGWAEILTGYSAIWLKITSNRYYKPIPKGYTIFERLEEYFGIDAIATVFIGGKFNNIGARGPHEITLNVPGRDPATHQKTFYWDKKLCVFPAKNGQPYQWVYREGEPYFYTKDALDLYKNGIGDAKSVVSEGLFALEEYKDDRFFMFFHFEEPDKMGHVYGENSVNYSDALQRLDYWLGVIVKKLKVLNLYDKTVIFVTSDHGMDEGGFEHRDAPEMFFATNSTLGLKDGDRKDITPTILAEYGIDVSNMQPPLDGKSLFLAE